MPVELCWNFDQVGLVAWTECPVHPFAVDDCSSPSTIVVNMHAFAVIGFVFIVCQTKKGILSVASNPCNNSRPTILYTLFLDSVNIQYGRGRSPKRHYRCHI